MDRKHKTIYKRQVLRTVKRLNDHKFEAAVIRWNKKNGHKYNF